jgi:hypothetical protein
MTYLCGRFLQKKGEKIAFDFEGYSEKVVTR